MATAGQRQVMGTPMLALCVTRCRDQPPSPAPSITQRHQAEPTQLESEGVLEGQKGARSLCVQRGVDTERDVDWGILRTRNRDGADRGDAIPTHSRQLLAGGGGVRSPDARRAHGATSGHGVSGR